VSQAAAFGCRSRRGAGRHGWDLTPLRPGRHCQVSTGDGIGVALVPFDEFAVTVDVAVPDGVAGRRGFMASGGILPERRINRPRLRGTDLDGSRPGWSAVRTSRTVPVLVRQARRQAPRNQDPSSELQDPRSKEAPSPRLQAPQPRASRSFAIRAWSLELFWSLEPGSWSFKGASKRPVPMLHVPLCSLLRPLSRSFIRAASTSCQVGDQRPRTRFVRFEAEKGR
jgi:hypothetical protein